ncbi:MAG: hypothetical protein GX230_06970, partial [Lentisphaerae bacterium]|nr:hypothetical protein [Lentisphaerota bacterium]
PRRRRRSGPPLRNGAPPPLRSTRSTKVAAAWVRHNMSLVRASGGKCRLWAGILRPAGMTTERFCDHVDGILDTGIEGVVVFQYPFLTDADLKALSQ